MTNVLKSKIAKAGLGLVVAVGMLVSASSAYALSSSDISMLLAAGIINATQAASLTASLGSTPSTGSTSCYTFTKALKVGSTGTEVTQLQNALSISPATGYFGAKTKTALMSFQTSNGLSAVGSVGPATRAKLNAMCTSGTPTPPPGTGSTPITGAVSVSLASTNPIAGTLATGTSNNTALVFTIMNGTSSSVNVTGLNLSKTGYYSNTNISGVSVFDGNGTRHGNVVTTLGSNGVANMTFVTDPIMVGSGQSMSILAKFNLASGSSTGTVGFNVNSASDVMLSTGTATGSFPLVGNQMSVVNGSTAVGTVTLDELPVNTSGANLNADANALQDIAKFRVSETSSNEDVKLYGLTLWNNGNAASTDYKDVTLLDATGTVLATAQPTGQNTIFSLATPYLITKGQQKDFWVRAKLVSGASRTIQFVVYNDYDLDVRGVTTGAGLLPAAGSNDTSFPIGDSTSVYNKVTVASGTLSLVRATDSSSSSVTPSASDVSLAKFTVNPTGESMELRGVSFGINQTTATLSGTVYVKVNGSVVYSAAANTTNFPINGAISARSLSSYAILNAGVDNTVEITASISSTAVSTDAYYVNGFDVTSVKRLLTNDIVDPAVGSVNGYTRAVQAAKLTVTTLSTPVATSVVAGTNGVELADFQLDATSSGEDVRVSTLTVTDTLGSGSDYSGVTNLVMKDSTGTSIATSGSTSTNAHTVNFNFSNPLIVSQTTPTTLKLFGNLVTATGVSHQYSIATASTDVVATGKTTGNTVSGSNLTASGSGQAMTVAAAGVLSASTVTGAGATPSVAHNVAAGTTGNTVFAFKLNSQYEGQKITTLTLNALATGAIRATKTLAVTVPTTGHHYTIGACAITFSSGTADSDCSDNAALVNITTNNTAAKVAAAIRAITGATQSSNALTFSGTGTNVIVTNSAVTAAAITLTDTDSDGAITASSSTTGVAATGALKVTDLANLKLSAQVGTGTVTQFATAPQFSSCASGVCSYTWTSSDNLLPSGMSINPTAPVTIYVSVDVQGQGTATLGDSFYMALSADGTSMIAKGVTTTSAPTYSGAVVNNNGTITNIVPFDVQVESGYPLSDTSLTAAAGTQVARFKITNHGTATVTVTGVKLSENGAQGTPPAYDLWASNENGNTYLYGSAIKSNVSESSHSVNFTSGMTSFTISGGSYKYITVVLHSGATVVSGDNWAFGIASLGDITYSVAETDLGYDGNANGSTSDTITSLPASGLPVDASFSAL